MLWVGNMIPSIKGSGLEIRTAVNHWWKSNHPRKDGVSQFSKRDTRLQTYVFHSSLSERVIKVWRISVNETLYYLPRVPRFRTTSKFQSLGVTGPRAEH